jgi:signal recognition particle receptor subunit beta
MVQFNFSERTIKVKVVYYGPAQSGKTTNLEQIHRITDPDGTNRLISLNTAQDRTLFFDLLPFSLGTVSGYDLKIQLYTVPGQVQYNATRRVVLAGADAVVFVADSRRAVQKENVAAFENMKVNLLANRLVPEKIPLVLQYNKRDLPELVSESDLDKALNPWQRPSFLAVATDGKGVMETFIAVVVETIGTIASKYNLKEKGLDPAHVPELVKASFAAIQQQAAQAQQQAPAAASPRRLVVSQAAEPTTVPTTPTTGEGGLVAEDLLHRAIRSNVELAEALGDVVQQMSQGLASILSQAEIATLYREDAKRIQALKSIREDALKLRETVQNLGATVEMAGGPQRPTTARPAPAPPPMTPAPVSAAPMMTPSGHELDGILRDLVTSARPAFESRGINLDLRIAPHSPTPTGDYRRAVSALLRAVSDTAAPGMATMRCEKKPVLLRTSAGEVRRDFLMIALAYTGGLSAQDQQRVLQGTGSGATAEAHRIVREMGGFLRFAPIAGGGLETRVFLPVG